MTQSADDLIPAIQVTSATIFDELRRLGLSPNMGKGKTEAILVPRGRNKTPVRQFVHHALNSRIPIQDQPEDQASLRVVAHYPHLGGLISHCGRMRGELRRRLAIGAQSVRELSSKVYNNGKVSLQTRLAIFKATTWPALTYNAGTWLPLTAAEEKLWHSGIMRLYRQVLKKLYPIQELRHFSDMKILDITDLPHPLLALRLCRLRYFGQTLDRGNDNFWALVAAEQTWLHQIQDDFDWLYEQIRELTHLPSPREHPEAWHEEILQRYPRWKGLLKRVERHAHLQLLLRSDVATFHNMFLEQLCSMGLRGIHREEHLDTAPTTFRCLPCQRTFASKCAWGSHCFKVHGRINACRTLLDGVLCQACGRSYPSNERLVRHLRTTTKCSSLLASLRLWTAPQPYYGNTEVRDREMEDSMIPWLQDAAPRQDLTEAQPMTGACYQLLRLLAMVDWCTATSTTLDDMTPRMRRAPPLHLRTTLDGNYRWMRLNLILRSQLQHPHLACCTSCTSFQVPNGVAIYTQQWRLCQCWQGECYAQSPSISSSMRRRATSPTQRCSATGWTCHPVDCCTWWSADHHVKHGVSVDCVS